MGIFSRLFGAKKQVSFAKAEAHIMDMWDAEIDKETTEAAKNADEAKIKQLIEVFDTSFDAGSLASDTLAKIGEPAVPFLIEALKEKEGYKFAWASVALEKMGRKARAAIPVLRQIANDPTQKENRRREALESIEKIR